MKSIDEGILLHRSAYSDTSLLTTFYTKERGLQKYIFKGGKKKAHQLFPLSISELNAYGRDTSDLLNLTSAEPITSNSFQFNPIKSTIAFFIAETIQKCVIEHDRDDVTYTFLCAEIMRLDRIENCALFPIEFMTSFTEILGFKPLIESSGNVFNLDEGTIGRSHSQISRSTSGKHIELIANLLKGVDVTSTEKRTREEALETLMSYYKIHVPKLKNFETYEIVKEVLNA